METRKKEILTEMRETYEKLSAEGLRVSLEDLERYFYLSDAVLNAEFVSETFERQISSRILEFYNNWHNYLNNLISPNAAFVAGQTECKLFNNKDDKEEIWRLIKICMKFSSENSLNGLKNDKQKTFDFIEDAMRVWKDDFSRAIVKILKRVNGAWKE